MSSPYTSAMSLPLDMSFPSTSCTDALLLLTCRMTHLTVTPRALVLAFVLTASAMYIDHVDGAYSVACFNGCEINYQVTKDCCTAVANGEKGWGPAQQHFDEPSWNCLSNNLIGGNSVNDGDVAKCCDSRGTSSSSRGDAIDLLPKHCG